MMLFFSFLLLSGLVHGAAILNTPSTEPRAAYEPSSSDSLIDDVTTKWAPPRDPTTAIPDIDTLSSSTPHTTIDKRDTTEDLITAVSTPDSDDENSSSSTSGGLSRTTKIALGASLGGGVVLCVLLGGMLFILRRRHRHEKEIKEVGFVPAILKRRSADQSAKPLMEKSASQTSTLPSQPVKASGRPVSFTGRKSPERDTQVPLLGHTAAPVDTVLHRAPTLMVQGPEEREPQPHPDITIDGPRYGAQHEPKSMAYHLSTSRSTPPMHPSLVVSPPPSPESPDDIGVVRKSYSPPSTASSVSSLTSPCSSLKSPVSSLRSPPASLKSPDRAGRLRSASTSYNRASVAMDQKLAPNGPSRTPPPTTRERSNTTGSFHRRITSTGSYTDIRPSWYGDRLGSSSPKPNEGHARRKSVGKGDPVYAPYRPLA